MLTPPHDKTVHTWHHSDYYLFMVTKFGIKEIIKKSYPNNIPIYKNLLNDKEIISVLSYIKVLDQKKFELCNINWIEIDN